MDFKYDVFLSHSSVDKPRVRELFDGLKALGLRVFLDERELHVGDSLYSTLNDALAASDYVVFCISRATVESGWVQREVAGSLATQIKTRQKTVLPVLLDDVAIPKLLSDLIWLDMTAIPAADVAAKIHSAIISARTSRTRAAGYPRDVREQVALALSVLAGERASPGFCWAIISGPSSAGKDVLSYVVLQRLQQNYGLVFLTKLTTRPRRPSEPEYVQQISDAEFEGRYLAGDIMFPFRKRTYRYGFDGRQFREALREGVPLLAVFTEFKLVPALVEALNSVAIRARSFFVRTEKADNLRRVLFRNLPPDEVKARITSIEQDYEEMAHRHSFSGEYVFIDNGDSTPFSTAATSVTDAIRAMIEDNAGAGTA